MSFRLGFPKLISIIIPKPNHAEPRGKIWSAKFVWQVETIYPSRPIKIGQPKYFTKNGQPFIDKILSRTSQHQEVTKNTNVIGAEYTNNFIRIIFFITNQLKTESTIYYEWRNP